MVLSLVISRIATVALTLTGIPREVARFQARSALTGTGFTTSEAETIVGHPVRRRIVMYLMVLRNAGLVTAVSSFLLSFTGAENTPETLRRVAILAAGLGALWMISHSQIVDRWLTVVIRWGLNRFTEIEVRDYARLLDLGGDYSIKELGLRSDDWLVGKTVAECGLPAEGILLLGLRRENGVYFGTPPPDTEFRKGDLLILYGERDAIRDLDKRVRGHEGDTEHRRAVGRQKAREREAQQTDRETSPE